MKPFGCPVTILNTRDHLGKFNGKANEGFFVGYSMGNRLDWIFADVKLKRRQNQGSEEDAGVKPIEVDESEASDKYRKNEQDSRSAFERYFTRNATEHPNSTNSINTVSTPISTAELSYTNDAPSSPVNAAKTSKEHLFEQFSPFKYAFALLHVPNVSLMDDNTGIFCLGMPYDRIVKLSGVDPAHSPPHTLGAQNMP
ncbi:hypothetical protein Tco_0529640 [Tanacetum coccineum]